MGSRIKKKAFFCLKMASIPFILVILAIIGLVFCAVYFYEELRVACSPEARKYRREMASIHYNIGKKRAF